MPEPKPVSLYTKQSTVAMLVYATWVNLDHNFYILLPPFLLIDSYRYLEERIGFLTQRCIEELKTQGFDEYVLKAFFFHRFFISLVDDVSMLISDCYLCHVIYKVEKSPVEQRKC